MLRDEDIERRLDAAENAVGVAFADRALLERALTHPSYGAEADIVAEPYERLEFLGDAVLSFVVADHLFRAYPGLPEGLLTKVRISLVTGSTLTEVAEELGLGESVLMGKSAEASGGRQRASILEDCFEALLGAIYLDRGLEAARGFIERSLVGRIDVGAAERLAADPKTALQEHTQARGWGLPEYRVISEEGPPHDRTFVAEVGIGGKALGAGAGRSKKDAEKRAAEEALQTLREGE